MFRLLLLLGLLSGEESGGGVAVEAPVAIGELPGQQGTLYIGVVARG